MPLLPALITVSNEGMHSCKCAILHARLVCTLECGHFLGRSNLWLHFNTWALFIFSPYTFPPAAMALWWCISVFAHFFCINFAMPWGVKWLLDENNLSPRFDSHRRLCRHWHGRVIYIPECMLANAIMCFPSCMRLHQSLFFLTHSWSSRQFHASNMRHYGNASSIFLTL